MIFLFASHVVVGGCYTVQYKVCIKILLLPFTRVMRANRFRIEQKRYSSNGERLNINNNNNKKNSSTFRRRRGRRREIDDLH